MRNWHELDFFFTDHLDVPLPDGHRFPMIKYRLLREALLEQGILQASQLYPARAALLEELERAHTPAYLRGLFQGTLGTKELRPIGLPAGPELLARSRSSVGGFIEASLSAREKGFSALLAGGTHHAHADRGEGYCVFNDFAVAALKLLAEGSVRRILIIDLDVHQGNGNSSILGNRQDVFILSVHGERNFPFRKVPSHFDVALPEGIDDETYLSALRDALDQIRWEDFDMIFYQAGVDVLGEDRLGTFNLSFEGIEARDRLVFQLARNHGLPLAMAAGGGYAEPIELTVTAHVRSFRAAREIFS